ncbi:MAG: pentapeptide repeat-containing protein, partial [Byssovorax sp.]
GFAKDFDWEFFNVAPKDQRIQGYFAPGEKFRVEGMNAGKRVLESALPNITARFFLVRTKEGEPDEFVEATSRLDTVLLLPNIERGIVIFRGMLPIAEDDGADVKHIIAAFEDPASPRSPEHYRAVLARRLDKNRGALESLLDDDLMPPPEPEGPPVPEDDWNDMAKLVEVEQLQATYLQRKVDKEMAATRERLIEQGLDPALLDQQMPPKAEPPPKDLRAFGAYMDRVGVQIEEAKREAAEKEKEALAHARARCEEVGVDFDKLLADGRKGGGGPPKFRADAELERLRDIELLFVNSGGTTPEISAKLADPAFLTQLRAIEAQYLDAYRRFAHHFPAADVLEGDASAAVRAAVIASRVAGESLARRDFTGADLSGLDLAGADLTEALLEGVNLEGAVLRGANLTGAVLTRGVLRGADFEGATLVRSNFGGADLTSARLNRADVTEAIFYQADLRGATVAGSTLDKVQLFETKLAGVDMSRVRASNLHFLDTDLTGAKFVDAELDSAIFLRCTLDGADFTRAILPKTCIVESRCNGSSFHEATLEGTRFALASSFEKGDFRGVKMKQTLLRGCNFAGADFTEARADDCDFSEADLSGSVFYRVSAQRSLFVRTSFRNADARSSNFMYAVLQKAKLHGADFRGANLFRADMAKVRGDKETNLKDAYLVQIRVVPEKNQAKVVP